MESNNYLCDICLTQLKIQKGKYLFSFNTECINGHKISDIPLINLLSKKKENNNIPKCEKHKQILNYLCKTCNNKDICSDCYNEEHNKHEADFISNIKDIEIKNLKCDKILLILKNINESFFKELDTFQNEVNLCIKNLKSLIQSHYDFLYQIANKNKNLTFFDIENIKNLFDIKNYEKNFEIYKKFALCENFFEKYDYFKYILIKDIKNFNYLDNIQKMKNLYKELQDKRCIYRLNNYFYLKEFYYFDDFQVKSYLVIEVLNYKGNKLNYKLKRKKFKKIRQLIFPIIISKDYDNNIPNEVYFYVLVQKKIFKFHVKVKKIKIINEEEEEEEEADSELEDEYSKYNIEEFDTLLSIEEKENNACLLNFIPLSMNKNIIFKTNKISIFDDSFKEEKQIKIFELGSSMKCLKINENVFVFVFQGKIHIINLENEYSENIINIDPRRVQNLLFNKDKKLLVVNIYEYYYLINFNTNPQEIIQKIKISDELINYAIQNNSLYFIMHKHTIFYDSYIFFEYKYVKGNLKCISKNEVKKSEKNDIKNIGNLLEKDKN